jgi:hypothetical protein
VNHIADFDFPPWLELGFYGRRIRSLATMPTEQLRLCLWKVPSTEFCSKLLLRQFVLVVTTSDSATSFHLPSRRW